ncbi:Armadillo repeat-containing protein 7 [Camellia lanceoleosa]|uniref:Armadillo repeat-containing protein 7 n=1 Tax=Camellia lanceoleosa TaxID=1840588 RepID=A0ACC0FCJ9_9ERIC|nr:Armadillo repeat-containing protein 7 [Camellia lanceoleosa]
MNRFEPDIHDDSQTNRTDLAQSVASFCCRTQICHIDIFGLREATKAKNHDENAWDWQRPLLATKAKNLAESKERIVANLANFAYDPYNYTFLPQLNILELFLDCLIEPNEKLVEFGVGGICNSCIDPANTAIVNQCGGIPLIIQCLSSPVRNTFDVKYAYFNFLQSIPHPSFHGLTPHEMGFVGSSSDTSICYLRDEPDINAMERVNVAENRGDSDEE